MAKIQFFHLKIAFLTYKFYVGKNHRSIVPFSCFLSLYLAPVTPGLKIVVFLKFHAFKSIKGFIKSNLLFAY